MLQREEPADSADVGRLEGKEWVKERDNGALRCNHPPLLMRSDNTIRARKHSTFSAVRCMMALPIGKSAAQVQTLILTKPSRELNVAYCIS